MQECRNAKNAECKNAKCKNAKCKMQECSFALPHSCILAFLHFYILIEVAIGEATDPDGGLRRLSEQTRRWRARSGAE
jgi:hypothetical protein